MTSRDDAASGLVNIISYDLLSRKAKELTAARFRVIIMVRMVIFFFNDFQVQDLHLFKQQTAKNNDKEKLEGKDGIGYL